MKRKFALLTLVIVASCSIITGCKGIPFLNKEEAPAETPAEEQVVSYVTPVESLQLDVGNVISALDLVKVADEKAADVKQIVFMNEDGSISPDFTIESEGNLTKTIVVEYNDGTTETIDVTITGIVSITIPKFSDALLDNITNVEWDTLEVPLHNSEKTYTISYSDNMTFTEGDYLVNPSKLHLVASQDMSWAGVALSKADEEALAANGESPLRNLAPIKNVLRTMCELSKSFIGTEGASANYTEADVENYLECMSEFYDEFMSVSSGVTDYVVYDVDGNAYPLKAVYYTVDGSEYGYGTHTAPAMYYIDYTDEDRIILADNTVMEEDIVVTEGEEEPVSVEPEDMKGMTYDKFKKMITDDADLWNSVFAGYTNENDTVEDMINNIVIGDIQGVKNDIKTLMEKPAEPTEGPIEPRDTETSTEVTEEAAEEVTEEVVEVAEEVTEAPVERTTYEQKYPELFVWTNGDNPNTYRRWYYTLNEETEFVGTIRKPDGSVIEGDLEFEEGFKYNITTGEETSSASTKEDGKPVQTYTLTSTYGNYEVTDAHTTRAIEFRPNESTSSRFVFAYEGNKYYIQTIRSTEIAPLMTNCLYPDSGFENREFKVTEGNGNQVITTAYGKIIPYTIVYRNLKGHDMIEQYMAVYNINNDYLVCYADNLTGTTNMFDSLLRELVIKK